MKVYVNFNFLENRNYIHSTSWLYMLLGILKDNNYFNSVFDINNVSAVFRSKKNKQGYYLIDEECDNTDIVFNFTIGDKKIKAYYIEDGNVVVDSMPYDEDGLVRESVIDKNERTSTIIIKNLDNIYNIIVSLNKKLLLTILPHEDFTSWSVGKFNLHWNKLHNNTFGKKLVIKLTNNIDNMYCKSIIYIDEQFVGTIDYARSRLTK